MCTLCLLQKSWTPGCDYEGLSPSQPDAAILIEGSDAPAGPGTPYTIAAGDTFNGTYQTGSDTDWVRVTLTAGTTYRFSLTSSAADTYLYLSNSSGTVLRQDDDGGTDTNSEIVYTAAASGTHYLRVSQYDPSNGSTGAYQLSMEEAAPVETVWTPAEMRDQLIYGYWEGDARHFDTTLAEGLSVNLTGLSATMYTLARAALQAWTDSTGLVFSETSGTADITFTRESRDSGPEAYASSITDGEGTILSSQVNVDQDWLDSQGNSLFTYTFQTYLHEIGHALGLGHAGNYNGNAVYGADNDALNDSWQMTVMSYFSQSENTYIADTYAYVFTPMLADLLAIAQMYGAATSLRPGDTVYGEGSTAGGHFDLFSPTNSDPDEPAIAVTLVDTGGIDTLDLRSDTASQRIDLTEGAVSDVYGDLGTLAIAFGTVIERVLAGSGSDVVTGNGAANRLEGNLGNDRLAGMDGNDSLYGGDGTDTLNGGSGDDFIFGGTSAADLRDVAYGGDGHDSIDGGYGNDELNGGNGNDTLLGGFGADTLIGNDDNDLLSGMAGSDMIYGNAGNDTLNGGFGHDRMNGGTGADSFFHQGVADHGSDWVQDYNAAEGDVLTMGLAGATASQFQVNFATTAGSGSAGVAEAFVIYRPTGQVLWALVDGADDSSINLRIAGQTFDLLA